MPSMQVMQSRRVFAESMAPCLHSCRSLLYASGSPFIVTRSATRLPTTRPDLPRVSSAKSGFFFCGMMEDPVEYSSLSVTKPNSVVDHVMISSHRRERCIMLTLQANSRSSR